MEEACRGMDTDFTFKTMMSESEFGYGKKWTPLNVIMKDKVKYKIPFTQSVKKKSSRNVNLSQNEHLVRGETRNQGGQVINQDILDKQILCISY